MWTVGCALLTLVVSVTSSWAESLCSECMQNISHGFRTTRNIWWDRALLHQSVMHNAFYFPDLNPTDCDLFQEPVLVVAVHIVARVSVRRI
jgi:hypothetical protein